ncbi:MAG: SpoIVB peptidase [Clostridia bacterium]|nr:SpoIVB peptidase [Clostridia bacterium]
MVVFLFIIAGNLCIPDEVVFYDNQPTVKIHKVFYAERDNSDAVTVSTVENSKSKAHVSLLGIIPVSEINATESARKYVYAGGSLVGIRLYTEGILVVGTDDVVTSEGTVSPAEECGIMQGDIITEVNDEIVTSVSDFSNRVTASDGENISVTVKRGDETFYYSLKPAYSESENKYRCGLWLRDSTAGIGTLTFADPQTKTLATLGHAICDTETQAVLPVGEGDILGASFEGCIPGQKGSTGQIKGCFTSDILGSLADNNEFGVYGTYSSASFETGELYPVASQTETETGSAQIISTVSADGAQFYDIEIEKITYSKEKMSRSMVIKVTDQDLLNTTGGIIQGMSGSPIIQNGMIVGAVTHVFLNDPTRGYGVFIENMLDAAG